MRTSSPRPQSPPVQFLVEIDRDDDGRVGGAVTVTNGHRTPYSGWLELLRLLEQGLPDPADRQER
jgi:hypothetical protein